MSVSLGNVTFTFSTMLIRCPSKLSLLIISPISMDHRKPAVKVGGIFLNRSQDSSRCRCRPPSRCALRSGDRCEALAKRGRSFDYARDDPWGGGGRHPEGGPPPPKAGGQVE